MINDEHDFSDAGKLRKKAEQQMKVHKKTVGLSDSEIDVKRLLHELQVHQIELEMQNEELRRVYEIAEKALKKFTMLYDFAPMGYFTLDSEGRICELNFTGAELLGDRHFSLVNSNFKFFVSDQTLSLFNSFLSKLYKGNTKESCEVMLGKDKNAMTHVYMEGIVTGDGRECLLSVVDISGFKNQNNN